MSLVPYAESEPSWERHTYYDRTFIAIGLLGVLQFDWDIGNAYKNLAKHGISDPEIERALTDKYGFVDLTSQKREIYLLKKKPEGVDDQEDEYELIIEERHTLFNKKPGRKYVEVVFTIRNINSQKLIRPISAHYTKERTALRKIAESRGIMKNLYS